MVTKQAPETTVKELPATFVQAIVDGHLGHAIEEVTVSAAKSPTKKEEKRQFDALYALDMEGMVLLCGGKVEPVTEKPDGKDERTEEQKRPGVCDHFNYGRILSVRQQVRTALETSLEGPEKTIAKAVKGLLDAGIHDSEAEAKAAVIAQMKAKGKLAEDYAG